MATIHEQEIDFLMNFFDRSGQGRVMFDEFATAFAT